MDCVRTSIIRETSASIRTAPHRVLESLIHTLNYEEPRALIAASIDHQLGAHRLLRARDTAPRVTAGR